MTPFMWFSLIVSLMCLAFIGAMFYYHRIRRHPSRTKGL